MALFTDAHARLTAVDIRLEDFLDDKIQSSTDLDSLDVLLASVEYQRKQLQLQLDDATKELEEARQSVGGRQAVLAAQIIEFNQLQEVIDGHLQLVATSDVADDVIRRLEKPMRQLHRVDLAQKYLFLLQDVERLRQEARSFLPQNPKAALEPYTRLKQLVIRLKELQEPADQAAAHLITYVTNITEALWEEMKKTMCNELEAVLAKRSWPKVDPMSEIDDEWRQCFEKLLDLQFPEILYSTSTSDAIVLLPISVMTQIFAKEFRFHFMSEKGTSNPQAIGTHCLPWVLALAERWEDFFRANFGPIQASKFRNTSAASKIIYMDPVCAFITSMLPVLREKVALVMPEAIKNPMFLSSLVSQLMTFDESIRTLFNYDGGDLENGWGGLTAEVLGEHFDEWFQAERTFALDRFRSIMSTPDARNIDYEYAGPGKTKPTHGAVRVTDLLRSVTSQYSRVREFSHQLHFMLDIQITILDEYHSRLRGSLEVYYNITSAVGRTLHGATKEQLAALEGSGALETLCKVYGSSDHIVSTLKDWSNEEFFVTLWEGLQTRAKGARDRANLAAGMSYEEVKDRTSASIGREDNGAGLFDETIQAYSERRKRSRELLSEALVESNNKAFKAYLHKPQWTIISDDIALVDPYQLTVTAELDEPLRILRRNLEFLSKALGSAACRRIWRQALEKLNDTLWSDILMSQKFTTLGAAQFMRDIHAISTLVDRYIPEGSSSLVGLKDGVKLLNLPTDPAEGDISLKRGNDMVFKDIPEAKRLLKVLVLDSLTPANARQILQRRVETSNE